MSKITFDYFLYNVFSLANPEDVRDDPDWMREKIDAWVENSIEQYGLSWLYELIEEFGKEAQNEGQGSGFFKITSVHRDDLKSRGFDTSEVNDTTMERLADKMSSAYTDQSFWIDLDIIAEDLGIPKTVDKVS